MFQGVGRLVIRDRFSRRFGINRFAPLDRAEDLDVFDFIRLHLEGIAVEFDQGTSGNNLNLIFTAAGPGTWAAAALLAGTPGYVRWRKRAKVS